MRAYGTSDVMAAAKSNDVMHQMGDSQRADEGIPSFVATLHGEMSERGNDDDGIE